MLQNLFVLVVIGQLLLVCATPSRATDLSVTQLVAPNPTAVVGVATRIKFIVANQNVQVANTYTIAVLVSTISGTPLFAEQVTGIPITPFSTLVHSTVAAWTPPSTGSYTIRLTIAFADDINPSNNVSIYTITAVQPQWQLLAFDEVHDPWDTLRPQDCRIVFTPLSSDVWRYLNLGYPIGSDVQWVLQNMPIPPKDEEYTYQTLISLPIVGPPPLKISVIPYLTTEPLVSMPLDVTGLIQLDYARIHLNIGDVGMQDTTKMTVIDGPPLVTVPTAESVTDPDIRSCDVPNIDLDSTTFNPSTVPGYAGDMNACASAAAANSMQWLEKHFRINTGLSHRDKLVELSKLMGRANETGVWSEDFIRAKLAYINKYNLPIKVKFQVRGLTKDIESAPEDDFENRASNQIEGAYPKWEWVKKEMHDSEDVEMFLEYHDRSGDTSVVSGRHVITATGVAESAGQRRFWYKDDGDQAKAGGTGEIANEWRLRGGTIPIIDHVDYSATQSRTTVVYGAISESYDSTLTRKEKSYWKKFKDRQLGWSPRYEHSDPVDWLKSHPLRFGNIYTRLRNGVYQLNEWRWVLHNHPIGGVFGGGTSTILNHNMLGIDSTRFPDPMEVRVMYTDEPVKEQPLNIGIGMLYPIPPTIGNYVGGSPNDDTLEPPPTPHSFLVFPQVDGKLYKVDTVIIYNDVVGVDVSASDTAMVGASAILHTAAAMSWLEGHVPELDLNTANDALRSSLINGTEFVSKQGLTSHALLEGFLRCAQSNMFKMRPVFQSFRLPVEDIQIPTIPEEPPRLAVNESVNGRIEWTWLHNRLRRFGPMPVEIGYYNASGRTYGTWALITGVVEHNGLKRLIMNVDMEEDAAGGQEKIVHTVQTDNGYHYLVEQSSDLQRAYIETVVSLEYQPMFVGVQELPLTEVYSIRVVPQPSDELVTISWQQAYTASASISVVDMLGLEHVRAEVPNDGTASWTTSTSQLPNGRYTIVIGTAMGRTIVPLMVVHH